MLRLVLLCLLSASWSSLSAPVPLPLDLEVFEDAECVRDHNGNVLHMLLNNLADILDGMLVLQNVQTWEMFEAWRAQHQYDVLMLTRELLQRPYCEVGKIAASTASCALLLQPGYLTEEQTETLVSCIMSLDAMLRESLPPELTSESIYASRVHLFLRSAWPCLRLLDSLVRLGPRIAEPTPASEGCATRKDIFGEYHGFNWEDLKIELTTALDFITVNPWVTNLAAEDGLLSERYYARWNRLHTVPQFEYAATQSMAAFVLFSRKTSKSGCMPGMAVVYAMQTVILCQRDTEAWVQRHSNAAWSLMHMGMGLTAMMGTDWPIYRSLALATLLSRYAGHREAVTGAKHKKAVWGGPVAASQLQDHLRQVLHEFQPVVYLTAVWGSYAKHLAGYIARWEALGLPMLLVLATDDSASDACHSTDNVRCISAPESHGIESLVTKYVALAVLAQLSELAVWLDFDVYLPRDPTQQLKATLDSLEGTTHLAFAQSLNSRSIVPAIICANGRGASASVLLRYASWLQESPYVQDHQGWDVFLQHHDGDFGPGWDYQGRNITSVPQDGLEMSFAAPFGGRGELVNFTHLDKSFASGYGWIGTSLEDIAAFHFYGAGELFGAFYPWEHEGFSPYAAGIVKSHHKQPLLRSVMDADGRTHITAISYADGCCYKAIERNRQSALAAGADAAISYNRSALDEAWVARNSEVLAQAKGAGWWLWKPYVILKTLRDEAVPWGTGVVLWLDAGNYFSGNVRQVVENALKFSDVAAMRLKCCMEADWTSKTALEKLDGTDASIMDRPQLGAYFLLFRKTVVTLRFVEDWLRFAEDPDVITEKWTSDAPSYQRHMADQSIFSVLFKQRGFEAFPLLVGHQVVKLERWRE